jgi:hypothetical protein
LNFTELGISLGTRLVPNFWGVVFGIKTDFLFCRFV